MNETQLRKCAKFLKNFKDTKDVVWDMSTYGSFNDVNRHPCRTAACAAGILLLNGLLPGYTVHWHNVGNGEQYLNATHHNGYHTNVFMAAVDALELEIEDATRIFVPNEVAEYNVTGYEHITPQMVAKTILSIVNGKGKSK